MPCILRVGEIIIPKRASRAIIYESIIVKYVEFNQIWSQEFPFEIYNAFTLKEIGDYIHVWRSHSGGYKIKWTIFLHVRLHGIKFQ
jgi:hypothetical protein